MQRMGCTWRELQAEPALEVDVIEQFIIGEDAGRAAKRAANETQTGLGGR